MGPDDAGPLSGKSHSMAMLGGIEAINLVPACRSRIRSRKASTLAPPSALVMPDLSTSLNLSPFRTSSVIE